MKAGDGEFVRQTLAMALGAVLLAPDTDTKSEMVERLKRSIEKVDAAVGVQMLAGTVSAMGGVQMLSGTVSAMGGMHP